MVTIMSENFAPMRTGTYPRKATMTRILIVEDEESYRALSSQNEQLKGQVDQDRKSVV